MCFFIICQLCIWFCSCGVLFSLLVLWKIHERLKQNANHLCPWPARTSSHLHFESSNVVSVLSPTYCFVSCIIWIWFANSIFLLTSTLTLYNHNNITCRKFVSDTVLLFTEWVAPVSLTCLIFIDLFLWSKTPRHPSSLSNRVLSCLCFSFVTLTCFLVQAIFEREVYCD